MGHNKPDGRSALNQGQIDILELLYTYRFGSRQLLADSLSVTPDSLFRKLEVLIKHQLIKKRHEPRLKLLAVPAAYYLTPKGLRTLATLPGHDYITQSLIKTSYKDGAVSQSFITQTLRVYGQLNNLQAAHEGLRVFTRRNMSRYSYFPKPLPDAFLSLKQEPTPKRFFLDVIPDSLLSKQLYQRLASYIEFFESDGWDAVSTELPILLFSCESAATERRVQRTIKSALYNTETDIDISAYTTTFSTLPNLQATPAVWSSYDDPEDLLSLAELG